jgi:DNA-binding beta-propeller fold protein YncE
MALRTILAAATSALALSSSLAFADLAISANDGKQVRAADGLPMKPTPDSVSIIAFSSTSPPKVIGQIAVCGTMIGPPVALAVAPDYSFALSTCPQTIDDANKLHPTDTVAVIGLDDPTHPKLLQTVHAGMGATGVFMNKKATIALVTGVGDDTVTLFTIKDRQLTQVSQVKLEAKAEPRDVIVAPDGKTAWALRFGDAKVTKLKIDGDQLSRVGDYAVGVQPDGGIITADGRYLINNNFGGVPGKTDKGASSVLDTKTGKIVDVAEVGALPEHVVLSPDNKYLAVVVGNGSGTVKTAKNFDTVFGKLAIFKVGKGKLEHMTDGQLGHACQGAAWSDDGKALLVQCSVERDIEYFHFDGAALTRDDSATLKFESRPGAIVTAKTR